MRRSRLAFPAATAFAGGPGNSRKKQTLIELHWGKPLAFVISPQGDVQSFSTPEQARFWLHRKWPVRDMARARALRQIEAAMDCVASVGSARRAFIQAARSAGFVREDLMTQAGRVAAT